MVLQVDGPLTERLISRGFISVSLQYVSNK